MKGLNLMEDKTFELIEKIYVDMQEMKGDIKEVKTRLSNVEKTVLHIEQDHGQKLQALFDGHKQHSDQLDRIEEKVSKHEDIIVRKVK